MVEIGLVTVALVGAVSSVWWVSAGAGIVSFIVAGVWLRHQGKGKSPSSSKPALASPVAFKKVVADRKTQLKDYLSQLAETMYGNVLQPSGVSNAPIGTSERAFGEVLEKFFPGRVKTQLSFPLSNGNCYSTDFAVEFPELGIYIDCEVDEPYDFKSNHPTHCTDDHHDRYRNTFFLNANWIVVRFAEEQVVLHPESCCKELAFVIAAITGIEVYSKQLRHVPILQPMQQWTKRQAKKMAKVNSRNRYLNRVIKRSAV